MAADDTLGDGQDVLDVELVGDEVILTVYTPRSDAPRTRRLQPGRARNALPHGGSPCRFGGLHRHRKQ
ncbi:hypothetical protein IU487_35065 [Nocardia puris]|uniref:hypothetical protein n=1 Tax=Nocardia puris TaxID=208602 RepID=UPI001895C206|nr:hypothetical protein [Nocardia puris]MBF6216218.1 hypothetical protein [Nocardia puris]